MSEKVVYILGAGFSAPLGIPVMNNFLERSKDMFAENPESYSYFEEVFSTIKEFSFVKNYYSADLFNIEEILSILEMRDNLSHARKKSSFKRYIVDVVTHHTPNILGISQPSNDWLGSIFGGSNPVRDYGIFISCLLNLEFYIYPGRTKHDTVSKSTIQNTYSVVTLNYDLVIEYLCELINGHTDKESLKGEFLGFLDDDSDNCILDYAKLHGSIDSKNIIAPTWNKGIQSKEIKSIWSLAYKVISEANYIRIIGYSLPTTDSYVKFLLKSAVIKSNNLKRIDVICLDEDNTVVERYNEFIARDFNNFRFKNKNVMEYLSMVLESNDYLEPPPDPDTNPEGSNIKIATLKNLEYVHERFMKQEE